MLFRSLSLSLSFFLFLSLTLSLFSHSPTLFLAVSLTLSVSEFVPLYFQVIVQIMLILSTSGFALTDGDLIMMDGKQYIKNYIFRRFTVKTHLFASHLIFFCEDGLWRFSIFFFDRNIYWSTSICLFISLFVHLFFYVFICSFIDLFAYLVIYLF